MNISVIPDQNNRCNCDRIHYECGDFIGYIRSTNNKSIWFDTGAPRSIIIISNSKFDLLEDYIYNNNIPLHTHISNLVDYGIVMQGNLQLFIRHHRSGLRSRRININNINFIFTTVSRMVDNENESLIGANCWSEITFRL